MTAAFARLPRGRVLQYHNVTPAHFFAPYDTGDLPAGRRSAARTWRRWSATPTSRSATRTTTARSSSALGFDQHRRLPHRHRHRDGSRAPLRRPALERGARRRARRTSCSSAASRRTRRSKITSGWRSSTSATSTSTTASSSSAGPTACRATTTCVRALIAEFQMPADRFIFTGPVPDEDLAAYYRHGERLHLAVRARGLLRAAARSDGRRRAGAGLRLVGRARHAGRRRRAVRAQGPRVRRRAARRAGLQRAAARPRHRRPAPAPARLRRRSHHARAGSPCWPLARAGSAPENPS